MRFCRLLIFFQNKLFRKILSEIPSECQTVWTLIRPDYLSGLIWVETVCQGYQQTTLEDKELRVHNFFRGILTSIHYFSFRGDISKIITKVIIHLSSNTHVFKEIPLLDVWSLNSPRLEEKVLKARDLNSIYGAYFGIVWLVLKFVKPSFSLSKRKCDIKLAAMINMLP